MKAKLDLWPPTKCHYKPTAKQNPSARFLPLEYLSSFLRFTQKSFYLPNDSRAVTFLYHQLSAARISTFCSQSVFLCFVKVSEKQRLLLSTASKWSFLLRGTD